MLYKCLTLVHLREVTSSDDRVVLLMRCNKHMTSLRYSMGKCDLSNKSIQHVVDGLSQGCPRLTSLE